ncbi:MAG: 50S ribosomal protein L24 [Planctomycetia bacterium]|nr:50S ribosomal protein L24 [Planctomycetia bacterium]
MRIRKGDKVRVISGLKKGKTTKVVSVDHEAGKVLVEGVNTVKKHVRPNKRNPQGGILEIDMPIDISNVQLVCESCNQPTRVGARILPDGSKERFCKKCNASIGQISPPKKSRVSK